MIYNCLPKFNFLQNVVNVPKKLKFNSSNLKYTCVLNIQQCIYCLYPSNPMENQFFTAAFSNKLVAKFV